MGLQELTDADAIGRALDAMIATDPVRHTVLGSAARTLGPDSWAAVGTDDSTGALAVRSDVGYPVAVTTGWAAADLDAVADRVVGLGAVGVSGPVAAVDPVLTRIDRPHAERMNQRLHRLDQLTAPAVAGSARVATTDDRSTILDWYVAFRDEASGMGPDLERQADRTLAEGGAWLWIVDGAPVSLARAQPAHAGSARIGPVYTPPEHRGHGYAAAVTARATQAILDAGAIPVLFTDVTNQTANGVYRRLGYYPVGDYRSVKFG